MTRRRKIAAAVLALALALPSGALAQSAGDEQYQDPFSGQEGGEANQQQEPDRPGGHEVAPPAPAPEAEAGTEAEPAQASPAPSQALPRTGPQTPLALAYGFTLLIAGTALRRATRRTT